MIAHRLSTLDICERRLEIEHGRLVEARRAPKAASRPRAPEVITKSLEEHPAVKAWSRLHPEAEPRSLTVLKQSKKKRKSAVFRLDGCAPDGASVIAKLCRREDAALESRIYRGILPRLPIRSPRYYGTLTGRGEWSWIFIEDAGDVRYSPLIAEHRRAAARWLASMHGSAARVDAASLLPDRGPANYLNHLRSARQGLLRQLQDRRQEKDEIHVLGTLVFQLDVLESRWHDVRGFCEPLPRTLVHGDFSRSNLRVRQTESGPELVAFDWERAGWGVPPPDLARLEPQERRSAAHFKSSGPFYGFCADPSLETYGAALQNGMARPRRETVERMAAVGILFQCLATIDWLSLRFTPDWTPQTQLVMCSIWLSRAMQAAGWTGGARVAG
jgi:hypothetical protein